MLHHLRTSIRADEGFTLTELVVVLMLMGFVLSVAWATFNVVNNGSAQSNREAVFSDEVGAPLDFAERLLSQQFDLDATTPGCGPYRCAFYTDRDNDGNRERYVVTANASGEFVVSFSEEVDSPTVYTGVWSDRNANVNAATPLFVYRDYNETTITAAADVYANARSVDVTIVAEFGDRQIQDTRRVYFRNR
jgi:prepilin-type N-terminal cleavage/methylation domain-containing protein